MIKNIEKTILSYRRKFRYLIDNTKFQLKSITKFFDYIKQPLISSIRYLRDIDIPSSIFYNKFINSIETDINLIHSIQEEIRNGLLSSWNVIENSYPEKIKPHDPYDNDIITEHNQASVMSDRITLGIKDFSSVINRIKDKPILRTKSSEKKTDVYYGKMFGSYIEGNESGEDGIRYENNDGSLIVDEKDTFWEAEAVVLQESRDNTKYLQSVYDKDISLSTTIKIIFTEPVSINTLTLIPYNAAVNAYYKLTKIEVSDGIKILPLDIKETFIISETTLAFDLSSELQDQKIRSIFITLKQESGYFMKYTLGYFKVKNNESWVDITGPHVTQMARARGSNFNENISYVIEHAPEWILNYWLPGVIFEEPPELVKTMGYNGYLEIPSSESKRKRYTIGIQDLKIGLNEYYGTSEKVTKSIDIPEGYNTVSLEVNDIGMITYFLSFDDGMTWYRILPIGKEPIREKDLRLVPDRLYINSDLSTKRKANTDTGEKAFIDKSSKNVRVRFVLENEENGIIPAVYKWNINFGVI